MLFEVIRTLQVAIVMLAGFTIMLWWPVGIQVGVDHIRGRPQMGMNIRLWRLGLGTLAAVAIAFIGFFPAVLFRFINMLGVDDHHVATPTILSLLLFYAVVLWFASWGRAARQAMRAQHPHPWDSEDWLGWPYLQYVAIIILIGAAFLTIIERSML